MASKHDEMLIYHLHITVLDATTGTNFHLPREKSKCLRQRATSVTKGPPLSRQCSCTKRSWAALCQRAYADTVQQLAKSCICSLLPYKICPAVGEKVGKHTS